MNIPCYREVRNIINRCYRKNPVSGYRFVKKLQHLQAGQATTYVSEISGWQSTPATPWHEQAYTVAAAQVTFTAAQQ